MKMDIHMKFVVWIEYTIRLAPKNHLLNTEAFAATLPIPERLNWCVPLALYLDGRWPLLLSEFWCCLSAI